MRVRQMDHAGAVRACVPILCAGVKLAKRVPRTREDGVTLLRGAVAQFAAHVDGLVATANDTVAHLTNRGGGHR